MQFTTFAVASVFAAAVAASTAAHGNVTYVTEVLTEYTTYCPGPTTLTYSKNIRLEENEETGTNANSRRCYLHHH